MPRYRFADFVLSPRQRTLVRAGEPLPLIPRYFDLLRFLIERRADAVHRRDIFDGVWTDVIVSDSALSQAIRTLRRTLGDDPREPRYIRTVSRHGYQFVCVDLVEEDDDGSAVAAPPTASIPATPTADVTLPAADDAQTAGAEVDPRAPWLALLLGDPRSEAAREEQRDAAERLHALGTAETLRRLEGHPQAARARAVLRDTRHQVAGAGPVPLLGLPDGFAAARALVALRGRRAARLVAGRWIGGTSGGALAGATAGFVGGLLLALVPGATAPLSVAPVLAAVGAACGAFGGAGVSAGLSVAEAIAFSGRRPALMLGAALGGGLAGGVAQVMARWTLGALFGLAPAIGGLVAGLVIGAGVGAGYAFGTRGVRAGLAAPRRRSRLAVALYTGAGGALAALALSLAGIPLVGGTLHLVAQVSAGAQVALTPLGRLLGEPEFGPLTRTLLALAEGGTFGAGLAFGLTRRP